MTTPATPAPLPAEAASDLPRMAIQAVAETLVAFASGVDVAYPTEEELAEVYDVSRRALEAAAPHLADAERARSAPLLAAYHKLYEAWENGATVEIDLRGYNGISYGDTNALDEASDAVADLLRQGGGT